MPLAFALPLLALATTPAVDAVPMHPPGCAPVQRVELGAGPDSRPPEVCVGPSEPTHFLFDMPLREGGVRVEERGRFADVAVGERSVTVYPSESVVAREPLTLTACFADGAIPECATFLLLPHPGQVTGKVTVVRAPRTEEQFQTQLARTRAECQGPGGLTGALALGLIQDGESLKGANIRKYVTKETTRGTGADLKVVKAAAYRARGRVAAAVSLWNGGERAWEPGEVTLRAATGSPLRVLSVWPQEPLPPGASALVVVEAATPEEALPSGPYTLTFGPEARPTLVLTGVTFP